VNGTETVEISDEAVKEVKGKLELEAGITTEGFAAKVARFVRTVQV